MSSVGSDEREEILAGCIASGSYVRVVLEDVPQSAFDSLSDKRKRPVYCFNFT